MERAVCEVLRSLARRRREMPYDGQLLTQLLHTRLVRAAAEPDPVMLAQGLAVLQASLADRRLQWILDSASRAPQAQAPLALTGMFSGRLTSIRADVSFRDAEGSYWLIDIAPRPRQSLAEAFGLRLARHVHLARALDHGPVRAAIYLPAAQLFWTGDET